MLLKAHLYIWKVVCLLMDLRLVSSGGSLGLIVAQGEKCSNGNRVQAIL